MVNYRRVRPERIEGTKGRWAILDAGARLARVVISCSACGRILTLSFLNDPKLLRYGHQVNDHGHPYPCRAGHKTPEYYSVPNRKKRVRRFCGGPDYLILADWRPQEVKEAQIEFSKSRIW